MVETTRRVADELQEYIEMKCTSVFISLLIRDG